MKTKEIFKDVPGYEGYYQASNMGNVRSVNRTVVDSMGRERFFKGRVIDGYIKTTGYRQTTLNKNGVSTPLKFSQIIAMTYLSHTPDGHTLVVDHINGVKTDDRLSNLRIVTHRENTSDNCFRKDRQTLSSKFTGVSWSKRAKKWRADIQYEGKAIHLGVSDSELEAYQAYQKALVRIEDGVFNPLDYKPVYTSSHKGVSFNKQAKKWVSYTRVNDKRKHVGYFSTEIEAYEALQKFKIKMRRLNDE